MIKIERISVMNFENAIRGARNPMNSWEKSDSYYGEDGRYIVGPADLALCHRLSVSGSDHRKYLRQIFVSMDITAPLYWWKEFDTYKVATVANSCSTMHKIHANPFTREDFSHDRLSEAGLAALDALIAYLEECRLSYLATKEKGYWHDMIQLLPSSYNQMRTVTMNYETLVNVYYARRHHKLAEWHELCRVIEEMPYAREMILVKEEAAE